MKKNLYEVVNQLTSQEVLVADFLVKNKKITISEVMLKFNISESRAKLIMEKIVNVLGGI